MNDYRYYVMFDYESMGYYVEVGGHKGKRVYVTYVDMDGLGIQPMPFSESIALIIAQERMREMGLI